MTPYHCLSKEHVEPFLAVWDETSRKLEKIYGSRETGAEELMLHSVENYEQLLGSCSQFHVTPINGEERLQFIKANLHSFAAYRQLKELYSELSKRIAAERAKKNKF